MDALAGGKTANLIYAGLEPGTVGIYRVRLQLNPDLPTNPLTQVTIAQYVYVSNIVTVPINAPVVPSSIVCSPTTVTSSNTSTCTSDHQCGCSARRVERALNLLETPALPCPPACSFPSPRPP